MMLVLRANPLWRAARHGVRSTAVAEPGCAARLPRATVVPVPPPHGEVDDVATIDPLSPAPAPAPAPPLALARALGPASAPGPALLLCSTQSTLTVCFAFRDRTAPSDMAAKPTAEAAENADDCEIHRWDDTWSPAKELPGKATPLPEAPPDAPSPPDARDVPDAPGNPDQGLTLVHYRPQRKHFLRDT
jgi:hypothetical protein